MSRCQFCPRQSSDSLHGIYDVCNFCKNAFDEGFKCGRLFESARPRIRDQQRHPKGKK